MSSDGTEREYVLYECGHRCWDAGIGGAPNKCSRCGAPIDAVKVDLGGESA